MSWIQTRRRAQEAPAGRPMEDTLRRQMAWAAGTEQFQHRDPLYHVTESFQQTFDAIGRRHAQELAGGRTEEGAEERADQTSGENQMPDQTSARSFYERSRPEDQDMVRRFSETAFQRGTLSGAVLEGTGQMMLFSCLKKTVGQSQPDKWQQRKLFEKASPVRNVPGHNPDKVVFNRGFTNSAVGLVVDTLRDARRTVEEKFGIRMDQVELRESSQPAEMDAKAFAKGNVVQFAPGQFRPELCPHGVNAPTKGIQPPLYTGLLVNGRREVGILLLLNTLNSKVNHSLYCLRGGPGSGGVHGGKKICLFHFPLPSMSAITLSV